MAIQDAQFEGQTAIALIARDPEIENPIRMTYMPIGIEIAVGRLLTMPDGSNSALVQGRRRVEVVQFTQLDPYMRVRARPLIDPVEVDHPIDAEMRTARDLFEKCVQLDRSLPDEAHMVSLNINEPGWLADMVATAISLPI